jgi:hypothetical protein
LQRQPASRTPNFYAKFYCNPLPIATATATEPQTGLENNPNKVDYSKPRQLLPKQKRKIASSKTKSYPRSILSQLLKVDVVVAIVVATSPSQPVATSRKNQKKQPLQHQIHNT